MSEKNEGTSEVASRASQEKPSPVADVSPELPQKSELTLRSAMVLTAGFFAMFCTVGFQNAYGVFQQYYTQHFLQDKTEFQISWLGSFAVFMLFVMAPLAGFINDRYGPTITVGCGAVIELVAVFMVSLCTEYYQFFLAQGFLLGLAMPFISIPAAAIVPRYFPRNRGAAQGITIAGSSLGGVLWPIALNLMLGEDGISFGWTLRIVGFIMLGCLALVLLGLRRPLEAASPKSPASAEQGESGGITPTDADRKKEAAKQMKTDLARLKHPSFIFLCAGLALAYFGFFVPFFFVSTYAVHIGASESFAFYLISILNAASLFGRILPGFVADRFGYFNVLTISIFGSGVVVFCWTAATSVAGLVVWTIAFGFISGAILSLQFAAVSVVATHATMGMAIGILMFAVSLTALFGTPIAGELVQEGFLVLSMYAGAVLVAGGLLVLCARLARSRELWVKV